MAEVAAEDNELLFKELNALIASIDIRSPPLNIKLLYQQIDQAIFQNITTRENCRRKPIGSACLIGPSY
jgi:hypothetical protein